MGFAAVTNPLQPPLPEEKDPTRFSCTHTFFLLLPPLQLPPWTEPCPVEEAPVK